MTPTTSLRCALVLATMSAFGAQAADLRPLSEGEMSGVYGQGLAVSGSGSGFAALTAHEQASAFASAADAAAGTSTLGTDGGKALDRQLAQQQLQSASTGLQTTIHVAQTLATVSQALAPAGVALPAMPLPFLFGFGGLAAMPTLPTLPSLPNSGSNNKH